MKDYPTSAADARLVGAARYFTGRPCPRGHVALRKTVNTTCHACNQEKKGGGNIETKRARQRIRNRRDRLARRGGCTPEMKAALIDEQKGACAICLRTDKVLFVDHCHSRNKIRSALCHNCNIALGHVKDDPALLRRMADYVEQHAVKP